MFRLGLCQAVVRRSIGDLSVGDQGWRYSRRLWPSASFHCAAEMASNRIRAYLEGGSHESSPCRSTLGRPEVRRFDARPIHLCNCEQTCLADLRWSTIGETTTLSSDNPVTNPAGTRDSLGMVASSDARTIGVTTTTQLTLAAESAGRTPDRQTRSIEVLDLHPPIVRTRMLGTDRTATCQVIGEDIYWTLILTEGTVTPMGEELEWDPRIQVRSVRHNAPHDRPIRIRHFGVDITVLPGLATPPTLFPPGIAYGGSWVLATRLAPGETCGGLGVVNPGTQPTPPPPLMIIVELTCGT